MQIKLCQVQVLRGATMQDKLVNASRTCECQGPVQVLLVSVQQAQTSIEAETFLKSLKGTLSYAFL